MRKILLIGWKDVVVAFRDRSALLLMLAAPFVLTLGLGFVTGRFSGTSSSGVSDVPVVLVNQDRGPLGAELVGLFQSQELSGLVQATVADDPAQARALVDADKAAAAVIVPAGFSDSIIPAPGATSVGEVAPIVLVKNPTRPTSVGVVQTILEAFTGRVEVGRVAGQVAVTQLVENELVAPQDAAALGAEIGTRLASAAESGSAIALNDVTASGEAVTFDVMAYMAPGMALMFLMYTVSNGGRTLLDERERGTLPRLLVSPTSSTQVLAGKVFGIFLTGVLQTLILIQASTWLFYLQWGDPQGVLVLVLAAVAGACGWGLLITALARTPGQVSTIGSAMMLTFGILGGSFFSVDVMPRWFVTVSRITPNSWALDGFSTLAQGGALGDILGVIGALLAMGAVLFGIAVAILNRRGIAQG